MNTISQMKRSHPGALATFFATLVCGVCAVSPRPALAYYGDCGQVESDGNTVHASDALYLLKTAVGNASYPAPLCVGDVDTSSSITAADALIVLDKSTGQPVTLTCPTEDSKCTPCNATAIRQRMNALTDDERLLADTSTIFLCQNQTLTITQAANITADNVIVSGRDRNVVFQRDTTCPSSQPSSGIRFVTLSGNDIVLRDMTINRYWNNIEVTGSNNTITNVTLDHPCSSGVLATSAPGTELRDSVVRNSATTAKGVRVTSSGINNASQCDEAYTQYATGTDRTCYDFASYNTSYINVAVPVRFADEGRYLVKGGSMYETSGFCDFPLVENSFQTEYYVRFDGVDVSECNGGFQVENDSDVVLDDVVLASNRKRGILARGNSEAEFFNSVIRENGGTTSSDGYEGGVAVGQAALVTLVSPDTGEPGNLLCGNVDHNQASANVVHVGSGGTVTIQSGNTVSTSCP